MGAPRKYLLAFASSVALLVCFTSKSMAGNLPGWTESPLTPGHLNWVIESQAVRWSQQSERLGKAEIARTRWLGLATRVRLGLTELGEINLGWEPIEIRTLRFLGLEKSERGFGDASLGTKWRILGTSPLDRGSLSLLLDVRFATRSKSLLEVDLPESGRAPEVALTAPFAWRISARELEFLGMMSARWAQKEETRSFGVLGTTALQWRPSNQRYRALTELLLASPNSDFTTWGGGAGIGAAWAVFDVLEVHASFHLGVGSLPNHQASAGWNARF